ncbi:MAG: YicC family protein [Candidatus Muproteobacteria bacterium RIFCSPHIGHO2_02_FULL_65_16]|uniref:YicC family protein n=1 Tax=Candidatus Muproteobacteria bacterium RIFCSPHIGHO2_02_FULL_65_16 TaxID=1817766 RepID=A0A1F6TZX8_9PROT|nr:MAG: YicC family protein [Candidatus Muproteobacteria bacterium RIFCSPHIGHO2_02_FULL_65_16]
MIHSMTAFARREAETPGGALTWELRSVNHRYLEIALRLPDELRALEPAARDLIGRRLSRGKLDGTMRFQPGEAVAGAVEMNEDQAQRLLVAAGRLRGMAPDISALRAIDVLRWPGVIRLPPLDVDSLGATALEALGAALDDLVNTRSREGARMQEFMLQRLQAMEQLVVQAKALLPETTRIFRERLDARLKEIKQQLDPARLEQEVVLFAQKSDVTEEIDRLTAHFAEIHRVFGQSGPIGRRLDFLMQELNREANTLGSKSVDIRMTNVSVELKVLIEQLREQVQNIE